MKIRAIAIALLGLSLLGLAALPYSVRAAGLLQDTETPPPTIESCLTLQPDEQSDCFATKAAVGELQQQTQEVLGVTATAQAIEQNIQGTLQAGAATATPQPTEVPSSATPSGFSLSVPGLENVQLNLAGLVGLGVCAVGGIVLIALGVYLVRGSGGEEEEEGPPPVVPRSVAEPAPDVKPLVNEPVPPPMPELGATRPSSPAPPLPPVAVPPPPLPAMDATLAEHRMQGAAAPGTLAVLVSSDGQQVRVSSGDFSIGRAFENDFVVDARFAGYENVSAEHARLVQDSSQRWLVEDLGSANGTYVNGRPTTMNVLQDGWRLAFGPVEFTFRLIASEEQS
jgi:pSer/pThr/pTyr-binding forkhead associated (FHA) protein